MKSITRKPRQAYSTLRSICKHYAVSQAELGEIVGLSPDAVGRRMRAAYPWDVNQMHKIMQFFNLKPEAMAMVFPADPFEENGAFISEEVFKC